MGLHLKNMHQIEKPFKEGTIKSTHLKSFIKAILDTYGDLSEKLENKRLGFTKYIEGQMIAMAITLFRINYDFDPVTFKTIPNNTKRRELNLFDHNSAFRYFYDMIRNFWSGNGDNKLFDIVTSDLNSNKYLQEI
jgi:hypothetical protein